MNALDAFRAENPGYGIAVYAYGGPEIIVEVWRHGECIGRIDTDAIEAALDGALDLMRVHLEQERRRVEDADRSSRAALEALAGRAREPEPPSIFD